LTAKVTPVAVAALITALANPSVSMAEDVKVLASNVPEYPVGSIQGALDVPRGGRVKVLVLPCNKTETVVGPASPFFTCLNPENEMKGSFPLKRRQ
jgi:hypothetical protein